MINEMSRNYRCGRFVHRSTSSLGVFTDECSTFLVLDKKQQLYIIKKMIIQPLEQHTTSFVVEIGIGIAQTYCNVDIFSFLSFFLFLFCFVLFFLIIQSQAVFVNYQYVARFTIVHSKTQIKFPLDKTVKTVPTCLQGF